MAWLTNSFLQDNEINQKVLKRQLLSKHYVVTLASDGQQALDILQAESDSPGTSDPPIDLVLMDIQMVWLFFPPCSAASCRFGS